MKITESALRNLVRKEIVEMAQKSQEELSSIETTLTSDIDHNFLEAAKPLKEGQDVTSYFENDIPRPMKAVVVNTHGPGGGNPEVKFTFLNEDHAWEWASNNMDTTPEDFELMLNNQLH